MTVSCSPKCKPVKRPLNGKSLAFYSGFKPTEETGDRKTEKTLHFVSDTETQKLSDGDSAEGNKPTSRPTATPHTYPGHIQLLKGLIQLQKDGHIKLQKGYIKLQKYGHIKLQKGHIKLQKMDI